MKFKKGQVPKNKLSQEEFLRRCENRHKGFYDYSEVVYKSMTDRIDIICPEHGKFNQIARNHERGDGCRKCFDARIGSSKFKGEKYYLDLIERKYEGKFEVISGEIKNNKSLLTVRCKVHDLTFTTAVANLCRKQCCNQCTSEIVASIAKEKREEWVRSFLKDYKHIACLKIMPVREKSDFFCNRHEETFSKSLDTVKRSNFLGCSKCNYEKFSESFYSANRDKMIGKLSMSESLHQYDYSKSEYSGYMSNVNIECVKHGVFTATYSQRMRGKTYGECPKCMYDYERKTLLDDFIQKANEIHGDKCDYSLVTSYTNCKDKVPIICNRCEGIFEQTPDNHLQGKGCSICNSIGSYSKRRYVEHSKLNYGGNCGLYLIECSNDLERFYKVGVTMVGVEARFSRVNNMPYDYKVMHYIDGHVEDIVNLEVDIHKTLKPHHYVPSIPFGGHVTECFSSGGLSKALYMINEFKKENI